MRRRAVSFRPNGSPREPNLNLLCWSVDELKAARRQGLEDLVWIVSLRNLPQFRQGCSFRELLEDVFGLGGCSIIQVDKVIVKACLLRSAVEFIDHVLEELVDCFIVLGIGPVTTVQSS